MPELYDRSAVVDRCVFHAWSNPDRRSELSTRFGILSEQALREHVTATLDAEDTRGFHTVPRREDNQVLGREFYSRPFGVDAKGRACSTVVILNPDRDENGEYHGGTCFVTDKKQKLEGLAQKEHSLTGAEPQIVIGGWTAVQNQASRDVRMSDRSQDGKAQTHQEPTDRSGEKAQNGKSPSRIQVEVERGEEGRVYRSLYGLAPGEPVHGKPQMTATHPETGKKLYFTSETLEPLQVMSAVDRDKALDRDIAQAKLGQNQDVDLGRERGQEQTAEQTQDRKRNRER